MPKNFVVHGVPHSIAMDAWWMESDAEIGGQSPQRSFREQFFNSGGSLGTGMGGPVFLIVLGDFLFWDMRPGVTLAIFAMAVFAVAAVTHGEQGRRIKPTILMVLSVLPVVEHVQLLSVAILMAGGLCAIAWLRVGDDGIAWIAAVALRLLRSVPSYGIVSLVAEVGRLRQDVAIKGAFFDSRMGVIWRNWAFPAGGVLVFGSLLVSANPVLEQVISDLFDFDIDGVSTLMRIMFWLGLGLLIWPLINPPHAAQPLALAMPAQRLHLGLNCGSVLRGLIVFNLLLAVQSIVDVSILFAGADLPDNMSYATYAHRGAYPLLVTAMLAGGFTFAARPFLREHRWIKPLLLLWGGQNVLLTLSSLLRLELYISEYGLTYLRLYALIWMGLVAVGLVVVLWHVVHERASSLLLGRLAILGFGCLYLCAFLNFSGIIATHTMARASEPEHAGQIDWRYLCDLGPTAHKAIFQGLGSITSYQDVRKLHSCRAESLGNLNWRELDFRILRTRGYLFP